MSLCAFVSVLQQTWQPVQVLNVFAQSVCLPDFKYD